METVREPLFVQETPWLAGWSSGLGGLHCLCVGRGLPLFCLSLTLGWRGGRGAAHSEPRPLGPPLHFHFLRVGWPARTPCCGRVTLSGLRPGWGALWRPGACSRAGEQAGPLLGARLEPPLVTALPPW